MAEWGPWISAHDSRRPNLGDYIQIEGRLHIPVFGAQYRSEGIVTSSTADGVVLSGVHPPAECFLERWRIRKLPEHKSERVKKKELENVC